MSLLKLYWGVIYYVNLLVSKLKYVIIRLRRLKYFRLSCPHWNITESGRKETNYRAWDGAVEMAQRKMQPFNDKATRCRARRCNCVAFVPFLMKGCRNWYSSIFNLRKTCPRIRCGHLATNVAVKVGKPENEVISIEVLAKSGWTWCFHANEIDDNIFT